MIIERIPLHGPEGPIYLDAYWLHNSPEFQADRPRPVVIVCPGGGYTFTSDREAEPIAMRFLAQGYHACVLRYSVNARFPAPMLDLAEAIRQVRANSEAWYVNPNQVVVCGFSAGGHLAACGGVLWEKSFLYEAAGASPEQIRPDALVLGYPVIDLELTWLRPGRPLPNILATILGEDRPAQELLDQYRADRHVTPRTPPAFIWHTAEDEIVPVLNALRFATALAEQGVPFEQHIFEHGEHGLALADEVTEARGKYLDKDCQIWVDLALAWLRRQFGR